MKSSVFAVPRAPRNTRRIYMLEDYLQFSLLQFGFRCDFKFLSIPRPPSVRFLFYLNQAVTNWQTKSKNTVLAVVWSVRLSLQAHFGVLYCYFVLSVSRIHRRHPVNGNAELSARN